MKTDGFLQEKDPFKVLRLWLKEAETLGLREPHAMTLATASKSGRVSSRVVLYKELTESGLIFYTNYNSRKGKDLSENPHAAINFFWDSPQRQIKMRGRVKKTSREKSESYWQTRPRESQLSQYTSKQSQPVDSRETMLEEYQKSQRELADRPVVCPEHWGGYLFTPDEIEFWVGDPRRFHDRFLYRKVEDSWKCERLYP